MGNNGRQCTPLTVRMKCVSLGIENFLFFIADLSGISDKINSGSSFVHIEIHFELQSFSLKSFNNCYQTVYNLKISGSMKPDVQTQRVDSLL